MCSADIIVILVGGFFIVAAFFCFLYDLGGLYKMNRELKELKRKIEDKLNPIRR